MAIWPSRPGRIHSPNERAAARRPPPRQECEDLAKGLNGQSLALTFALVALVRKSPLAVGVEARLFGGEPPMHTTNPWIAQVKQACRDGHITDAQEKCLFILLTFRGRGGLIFPSHETIAARAGPSVSTVQRALNAARACGLLRWAERRVRSGWRSLRTSNCYELLTTGQTDRGTLKGRSYLLSSAARAAARGAKEARGQPLIDAVDARRGLEEVRRRRQGALGLG